MNHDLQSFIQQRLAARAMLIMSHTVVGYPSLDASERLVTALHAAHVDMIEIQFPFSEPVADGPTLRNANQEAVKAGVTTDDGFAFAKRVTTRFSNIAFVIMTYYNVIFKRGTSQFVQEAAACGAKAIIVPDLPPEEAGELITACKTYGLSPIFLVTPKTSIQRIQTMAQVSHGMIYCVARTGVTGHQTIFSQEFDDYLDRVRSRTSLPLGVGFGIRSLEDVTHLRGRASIVIMCSKAIDVYVKEGSEAVTRYFQKVHDLCKKEGKG